MSPLSNSTPFNSLNIAIPSNFPIVKPISNIINAFVMLIKISFVTSGFTFSIVSVTLSIVLSNVCCILIIFVLLLLKNFKKEALLLYHKRKEGGVLKLEIFVV